MTKELKDAWIKALKSGEYEQGQRALRPDGMNEFCCLGVLCDVLRNKNPTRFWWSDGNSTFFDNQENQSYDGDICGPLSGELKLNVYSRDLVRMNDEENKSFNEIADWIEKNITTFGE